MTARTRTGHHRTETPWKKSPGGRKLATRVAADPNERIADVAWIESYREVRDRLTMQVDQIMLSLENVTKPVSALCARQERGS